MGDLVGLFTATAPGIAVLNRLNARINKRKPYNKHAKDAIRQVYTPTEAVWIVLELKCQRKGDVYCYVSCLRY